MADLSASFLSADKEEDLCLLFQKCFSNKKLRKPLTNNRWQKLIEKSLECRIIKTDIKYMFTAVCDKIKDQNTAFGYTHGNCCITFLTKVIQLVKRYGYKSHDASEEEILGGNEDISKNTRSTSKT